MKKNNPWNGAAYYEDPILQGSKHSLQFCGRDREIKELLYLVRNNLFVTLYGKSGLGKTSLLNAGLFPKLREIRYLPVYIRLGYSQKGEKTSMPDVPYSQLVVKSVEETISNCGGNIKEIPVTEKLEDVNNLQFLWSYFARHIFYNSQGKFVFPVIVLDQFEEFFRHDSKKAEVLMRQISFMTDGNHQLPDQKMPDGKDYSYSYNFRFVCAIREDELYRLEDCIDNNFLSGMKQNRMRLRGLSEEGAAEVIETPGQDCIKREDLEGVKEAIIKAAPNGDGTINTLLLSVICTNLFEQLPDGRLIDSQMTRNLDYPIETFYQEQIRKLPRKEQQYIAQELTNGPQRKPVSLEQFKKHAPKALKKASALFHLFPLPGTDKMHVELMHDRLAEIINNLQNQKKESKAVNLLRWYAILIVVIMACIALYRGQTTDDKNKVSTVFTEVQDHRFSTTDTLWIDSIKLLNNGAVEEFTIVDKEKYYIANCPYLTTIDLTQLRRDTFELQLTDLPMLKTIIMPENMAYLKLKTRGSCPRLTLPIHQGMGHLELDCKDLAIHIDNNTKRYVWKEKILWDLEERRIAYVDNKTHYGNTVRCFFPKEIRERSLTFKGKRFQNLQKEEDIDERSSYSQFLSKTSITIDKEHLDPGVKEIGLPDSVTDIPLQLCYQFHRLDSVLMPRKAVHIRESAFEGCDRLRSISLPDNLETIAKRAFYGCKQLRSVVIPASVKWIGEEAFAGCDSLRSITILGNPNLHARAFAFNQKLTSVNWKPDGTTSYIYFANPFFDCPNLDLQSLKINIHEKPECRTTAEGVVFSRDGNVYAREYPPVVHFPIIGGACPWAFIGDTSPITDIFVPFAHPDPVSAIRNKRTDFYLNLSESQKINITLHVPYGCRRYYAANPHFDGFKQIEEFSEIQTRWNFLKSRWFYSTDNLRASWYIHIPIFLGFVLLGLLIMKQKRKEEKWTALLPGAFLFAALTVIASVVFFWCFLYMDGKSFNLSGTLGVFMGLTFVLFGFYAREIWQWDKARREKALAEHEKRQRQIRRRIRRTKARFHICTAFLKRHWIIVSAVTGLCLLAIFGVKYYQYSHDIEIALKEGNYERALRLRAGQMLTGDSLTSSDMSELRQLLIRSGVEPRFNHTELLKDYHISYGSSQNDHYCLRKGDSIILWTDGGQRYEWVAKKHHLDSYSDFRVFHEDKIISIYDATHDQTLLYSMANQNDQPLTSLPGRLQDKFIAQNLLLSKQGEQLFLCDLEGHHIVVPEQTYNLTNISSGAIKRNGTVYTHCGDSLVYHNFGEGDLKGIIGKRYVLWEDKASKEKHFYDMANGFAMNNELDQWVPKYEYSNDYFLRTDSDKNNSHYVMSNDRQRNRTLNGNIKWQGGHFIIYEKDSKWYVFDTRSFTEQEISRQVPDLSKLYTYSLSIRNDRYLIVGSTRYDRLYTFDLQNECRFVGQMEGKWFEDFDIQHRMSQQYTNHIWLEKVDSVQFYQLSDGQLSKGACLPMEIANEKTWTEGFIIVKKEGKSLLYSMDDQLSQPIVLNNELSSLTYLSGRTLIIPVGNETHVYQYDGLGELIQRSSLPAKYKEQLLTRIKR